MLNGDATQSRSRSNRPRETRNYVLVCRRPAVPLRLRPMASSEAVRTAAKGSAGRDQCAYESRGNRVRLTYLVGFSHFSASMERISVGLIFALLYRNLMAICQIWCEPCPPFGRVAQGRPPREGVWSAMADADGYAGTLLVSDAAEFEFVRGIER